MPKKDTHERVITITPSGEVKGIAPLVISASRATDIPAFHAKWFMRRLNQGYCAWVNPFNKNQKSFISFTKCKLIVFWSKNPKPLIPYLDEISAKGMKYYFQYTINDYENERFEPNVPKLDNRIETFIRLSEKIGKDKVIWRYDPIILADFLSLDEILNRIAAIGEKISPYTTKLVFSFVDMLNYSKVTNNLKKYIVGAKEPDGNERLDFAQKLAGINASWKNKLELATCAEIDNLSDLGINHNKCIDDDLIRKICYNDEKILETYGKPSEQFRLLPNNSKQSDTLKDKGQRKECGCALSKDIGSYNTCLHLCAYCYANHSETAVRNNHKKLTIESESLSLDFRLAHTVGSVWRKNMNKVILIGRLGKDPQIRYTGKGKIEIG